jgi:acyl-CoA-binding protein
MHPRLSCVGCYISNVAEGLNTIEAANLQHCFTCFDSWSAVENMSEDLAQRYKAAVATANEKTPPKELSQDQKLGMYAHFKQVEVGPCNTARPGIFDQTGRYKHDAWSKLGNMSKEEAMEKYIEIVNEAYGVQS